MNRLNLNRIATALAVAVALATSAGAARAAGNAYLSWNACYHDGGVSDISFPCGTGPGYSASLMVTFVPSVAMGDFVALDFYFDVGTSLAQMPEFWQFATVIEPSNCNPGIESHTERPSAGCASAVDTWNPSTTTLVGYSGISGNFLPNRGRIVGTAYFPEADVIAINPGTEYFGVEIRLLTDAATESGGACSGCPTPMTIALAQAHVVSLAGPDEIISPTVASACVTSNGGIDCFAVPVQNRTWGRLKQLYR